VRVSSPTALRPPRVFKARCRSRRRTFQAQRAEVPSPTVSRRPPAFETGPATRQVHSPWRKTENSSLEASRPPPASQAGTTTRCHLPCGERRIRIPRCDPRTR
jgi:hypothetical protein